MKQKYEQNAQSKEHQSLKSEIVLSGNASSTPDLKLISKSYFFELYEYLIMKVYFTIPFYPLLKPETLRVDFKLSKYLLYCTVEKLTDLFQISWMSYGLSFGIISLWASVISEKELDFQLAFMYSYPIIGLLVLTLLYIYFRIVYRRVVPKITEKNYMEYKDIDKYNQHNATATFLNYPVYVDNIMNDENSINSSSTIHKMIHSRSSNLYENNFIFGASGANILFNIMQSIFLIHTFWSCVMVVKSIPLFKNDKSISNTLIILGYFLVVIYGLIYSYLTAITMRWFTVISSIEMKKNDTCLKKTIEEQTQESVKISESIFLSFKKLYYDMKIKTITVGKDREQNKFNILNKPALKRFITRIVLKFKGFDFENYNEDVVDSTTLTISVSNELKPFLRMTGNIMTDNEIDFMLHFIENYEKFSNSKILTLNDLQEIWAVMIHFSILKAEEIFIFVFGRYYEERPELENTNTLTETSINDFFIWYKDYFTQIQIEYIEREISLLSKEISLDSFISLITSMRRYNEN